MKAALLLTRQQSALDHARFTALLARRTSQLPLALEPDMFHALVRFIFKLQFCQNVMIYGILSIAPDCPCYNVLYDSEFL